MKNLKIYCISMNPLHKKLIEKLEYTPVGLGNKNFGPGWLKDNTGENITLKNKNYGEYTFHYWLWKNKQINFNGWSGFCQYRIFWKRKLGSQPVDNIENLNEIILKTMFLNPSFFFNKKKRTIKFHFDMMHGQGNLDKAIQVIDEKEKIDFKNFVNKEVSFNPQNMFICKNKEILFSYYESLFPWLSRCEKIFGFKDLKGFGMQRIYGFLAERYMSYWFKKYTKHAVLPMQFKDITDFL